jgi:hypothetical protein
VALQREVADERLADDRRVRFIPRFEQERGVESRRQPGENVAGFFFRTHGQHRLTMYDNVKHFSFLPVLCKAIQ